MLTRFAMVVAIGLVLAGGASGARAQDVDRIAAVVNEDIISIRDLEARLKLALVVSHLPDNLENRRRAVPQVLRKMIDERIEIQEANRNKVSIGPDELARGIAGIEQQNRMPQGSLLPSLAKSGVDTDAVRDQIRADLTWLKLSGRMLQPNIRAGEEEVNERLEMLRQQLGQPEYLMAEIFLSVDNPGQEEEARRLGERLLDQLKAGAPFQALARQFSQSASAGSGGMLGWVGATALDDEVKVEVVRLEKGEVSPLIRTGAGYSIVAVLDKRISGAPVPGVETVTMVQVFFPTPPNTTTSRDSLVAKAVELTAPLKTCAQMEELGRKIQSEKSGRMDNAPKSAMPDAIRSLVDSLPDNKASQPQPAPDGLAVIMVCGRSMSANGGGLPTREAIMRHIEDEKMDLMSKRYLRDLRRAAFVDIRL